MSKTAASLCCLTLAVLLASCPGGGRPKPVEIVWNEDSCAECRMAVSDKQFGCEYVSPDGICSAFDDIGCLVVWARNGNLPEGGAAYVRDFESQEWIDAGKAHYMFANELPTPMRYGISAHASREAAEKSAQEWKGVVWDWNALVAEWKP
ncbi:hypothetical protein IT575_01895 [bacterium]|nr:hypothetical protein [bacterium]